MKKFEHYDECPKCNEDLYADHGIGRFARHSMKYHSDYELGNAYNVEYIAHTCDVCGYPWETECHDHE